MSLLGMVTVHTIQVRSLTISSALFKPSLFPGRSLVSGVMWFVYDGQHSIRHTCEHGDRLQRYGWLRHDGTGFGQQEIVDNGEGEAVRT